MNKKNGSKGALHINKRSLRYGSNSAILIVAVILIALLVNVLVGMADIKLDLTPNKLYSLSDVTKNELDGLKQEVQVIGLFDDGKVGSGSEYSQVTELLNLYDKYSNVTIEYIDPDKNPTIIKTLDPDDTMDLSSTDIVVKSTVNGNEKRKKLDYYDLFSVEFDQSSWQQYTSGSTAEQGITGAIRYVTSEKTPVVYFATGHDEISMSSEYTNLVSYLEKNNYTAKELNLLTTDSVPEDAELVIVASPKNDFSVAEKDKLSEYLDNGGNAMFMFDYLASDPSYDQINSLLSEYNVTVNYDKVKENDSSRHLAQDEYTILLDVNSNDIIPQKFNALLNNSRSIGILKNTKEYITTTSLMSTSDQAVGEMVDKSRGSDMQGPLDIAVAVENEGSAEVSKIVVMGNASFINDAAYETYGTYYNNSMAFFLYSMNWMIESEDEVIVPAKNYESNQLQITELQSTVTGGALMVVFPLLILGAGLMVYLRRRHL